MSDFITRLEVDLLDAAGRLHTSQDSTQAAGRTRGRLGRYRLLAAGLAVLVVAAPALAGVPGIWHGVFAGPRPRATSHHRRSPRSNTAARSMASALAVFATSASRRSATRCSWSHTA